jgi:cytochrome c-type biogenesis protein CcmE
MSRRLKFLIVVIILSPIFIYIIASINYPWTARVLSVDQFIVWVNESKVTEKQIVVRGKIEGKSVRFDKQKSELRFDLIADEGINKIHVFIKSKDSLKLKDGETVDVEGRYMVEKIFIAHKVSKY